MTEAIDACLQREFALDSARLLDVREEVSVKHDLRATLVWSALWGQACELWLRVIAEEEARVDEVNTVEGNLHRQRGSQVVVGRRIANDSHGRVELGAHDLIADGTVGNHSVVELLIEPGA